MVYRFDTRVCALCDVNWDQEKTVHASFFSVSSLVSMPTKKD